MPLPRTGRPCRLTLLALLLLTVAPSSQHVRALTLRWLDCTIFNTIDPTCSLFHTTWSLRASLCLSLSVPRSFQVTFSLERLYHADSGCFLSRRGSVTRRCGRHVGLVLAARFTFLRFCEARAASPFGSPGLAAPVALKRHPAASDRAPVALKGSRAVDVLQRRGDARTVSRVC